MPPEEKNMQDPAQESIHKDLNVPQQELQKEEGREEESSDEYDIESKIPIFTIPRVKRIAPIKNFDENIPLLIRDIFKIKLGDNFGGIMTVCGVNFKTIMIYGTAAPAGGRQKNDTKLYSVDDGTGSITVFYPHGKKANIQRSVNNLEQEFQTAKKWRMPILEDMTISDRQKYITSMEMIMNKIKKQCYVPEKFKLGARVSIIGIPFINNRSGSIQLYAEEMYDDSGQNRRKELFFKKNLIRFYRNNFASYLN